MTDFSLNNFQRNILNFFMVTMGYHKKYNTKHLRNKLKNHSL